MDYVSYSRLSLLAKSPFLYKKKYIDKEESETTISLDRGTLVDDLLTGNWENKYEILDYNKPSGKLGEFADLVEKHGDYNTAYEQLSLNNDGKKLRDSLDKFIEGYKEKVESYLLAKTEAENNGKKVISKSEFTEACAIKDAIKEGKYTKDIFEYSENVETYYQYLINENINIKNTISSYNRVINFKGALDIVTIKHSEKTIYVRDLKTTSQSIYYFEDEIYKWKYYIQPVLYLAAAKSHFTRESSIYHDYKFVFQFLVVNSQYPINPILYEVHWSTINKWFNEEIVYKSNKYKNVNNLINEYFWYLENGFDEYKEVKENNGIILI